MRAFGGSPATEQIQSGLGSTELQSDIALLRSSTDTAASTGSSLNSNLDEVSVPLKGQENSSSPQASVEQRRELLGSKLNNWKI